MAAILILPPGHAIMIIEINIFLCEQLFQCSLWVALGQNQHGCRICETEYVRRNFAIIKSCNNESCLLSITTEVVTVKAVAMMQSVYKYASSKGLNSLKVNGT